MGWVPGVAAAVLPPPKMDELDGPVELPPPPNRDVPPKTEGCAAFPPNMPEEDEEGEVAAAAWVVIQLCCDNSQHLCLQDRHVSIFGQFPSFKLWCS